MSQRDHLRHSREGYWHSRGYLPHFERASAIQHVTFHLADSLPRSALEQLESELGALPEDQRDAERRRRLDIWLDAGSGACVLACPTVASLVQQSLLWSDHQRYRLVAWVVMPNHVHVLMQPSGQWTVAKIVASWKSFTARRISAWRRSNGAEPAEPLNARRPGQVWHREYWDRYMRDEQHLQDTLSYIHANPVKAGLVDNAEDWPWSSATRHAGQKGDDANTAI